MGKKDDDVIIIQGCPLWMLTMGDCMSLLLTFFVMLMAFSTPNSDKLSDALLGMKGALGVMASGNTPAPDQRLKKTSSSNKESDVDAFDEGGQAESKVNDEELAVVNLQSMKVANRFNEFKERLLEIGFQRFVTPDQLNRGIVVKIDFDALFKENSSEIKPEAIKLLESFANLAGSVGNEIQMVARFDPTPIRGTAESQEWNLPRERVFAVGKILRTKYRIHESRFTYGYEVVGPNEKPALQMLIAEKLGVSKITIKELLNFSKDL